MQIMLHQRFIASALFFFLAGTAFQENIRKNINFSFEASERSIYTLSLSYIIHYRQLNLTAMKCMLSTSWKRMKKELMGKFLNCSRKMKKFQAFSRCFFIIYYKFLYIYYILSYFFFINKFFLRDIFISCFPSLSFCFIFSVLYF